MIPFSYIFTFQSSSMEHCGGLSFVWGQNLFCLFHLRIFEQILSLILASLKEVSQLLLSKEDGQIGELVLQGRSWTLQ